jgi:osmotically-inducible protein OsmY
MTTWTNRRRWIAGFGALTLLSAMMLSIACSKQTTNYHDRVKTALEQADLKDVDVSEDANANTIKLSGTLHTEEAKSRAGDVAQANAGPRTVANEISVQPVGNEGAARNMESNLDDGIENNYKAALISKGLDKQHIRYEVKNGVVTLKGSVKNTKEKQEAAELAQNTPNVRQVLNQIEIRR